MTSLLWQGAFNIVMMDRVLDTHYVRAKTLSGLGNMLEWP